MTRLIPLATLLACSAAWASSDLVEKAGEWVATISTTGGPAGAPREMKICRTHDRVVDTSALEALMTRGHGTCSTSNVQVFASGGPYDLTCTIGKMVVHEHGEITRPAPDTVVNHVVSHFEGATMPGMPQDMEMTVSAHRTGPCQPGDRPARD